MQNACLSSFAKNSENLSTLYNKNNVSHFREFKNIVAFNGKLLKVSVSVVPAIIDLLERTPLVQCVFFTNNRYYFLLYTDSDKIATCQNVVTGQQTIFHIMKIVHICLVLDAPSPAVYNQLSLFR